MTTLEFMEKELGKHKLNLERQTDRNAPIKDKIYSLPDYCDKRKSTDLTQFNYCPLCGKKIDWKAIKGGANG